MTSCGPRRSGALFVGLVVASSLSLLAVARAALPMRTATFAWTKGGTLLGTFNYRDAINNSVIAKKLKDGLEVRVFMRGYVYPAAGGDPIALTAASCKVAYQLWDEVYRVVRNGGATKTVANLKGVYRLCTDMDGLPIADKATLNNNPTAYYLAVKVEVNPMSAQTIAKIQQWVTRPAGANTSIGPGDALFASFVGVFMKNLATADYVVDFQTAAFPPP